MKTALVNISDKARSTREKPSEIQYKYILRNSNYFSTLDFPEQPTRKIILRARRKILPLEPRSLRKINNTDSLKNMIK